MNAETMTAVAAGTVPTVYELGAMSTQQLRGELARSLTMSAQTLAYLATIWRELEHRGEDLSDLRVGLAAYLPMIAAGQLDASVVIRFAGQPTTMRLMSTLPLDEQRRMANGAPVQVLTVEHDGSFSSVELPATALTASQVRLAFEAGRHRSVDEQRAVLEAAQLSRSRRSRPGEIARVRYDPRTDRIRVGSASASVGEVLNALIQAAPAPTTGADADLSSGVPIRLTEVEHKGLKIRAAQAGLSLQAYCRALLVMQSVV